MWQICGRLWKMWQIVADFGDSFWEKVHFPSSIILLYTLSQSTLHVKTQHGASAHTPRSIGLHSTEHRQTLHEASANTPGLTAFWPYRPNLPDANSFISTCIYLCRPSGAFVLLMLLYRGLAPPVCGLSLFRCFSSDTNKNVFCWTCDFARNPLKLI